MTDKKDTAKRRGRKKKDLAPPPLPCSPKGNSQESNIVKDTSQLDTPLSFPPPSEEMLKGRSEREKESDEGFDIAKPLRPLSSLPPFLISLSSEAPVSLGAEGKAKEEPFPITPPSENTIHFLKEDTLVSSEEELSVIQVVASDIPPLLFLEEKRGAKEIEEEIVLNLSDMRLSDMDKGDINQNSVREKIARCYFEAIKCLNKKTKSRVKRALCSIFPNFYSLLLSRSPSGNDIAKEGVTNKEEKEMVEEIDIILENIKCSVKSVEKRVYSLTLMDIDCIIQNANERVYSILKIKKFAFSCLYSVINLEYASLMFWEFYRMEYICSDLGGKSFYYFKDHGWYSKGALKKVKDAIGNFCGDILEFMDKFLDESDLDVVKKSLKKLIKKLPSMSFQDRVFKECCRLFNDVDFIDKINQDYSLLRFEDGVYDLSLGKVRKGRVDDYKILSTKTFYELSYLIPSKSNQEHARGELKELLEKVFPIPNIRKYFVRFISSCLKGGNNDKVFCIWTGLGDNGKSIMIKLIEKCFGEYSVHLPTTLITRKRASSEAATPELARMEGRLIAFLQEPNDGDRIHNGTLKELTGDDKMYVRKLFEEGRDIPIKAKIIFVVNKVCNIFSTDKATWNRIKVIPFMSTFVDFCAFPKGREGKENKLDNEKFIYLKDTTYKEKLDYLAPVFIHMLVEEYKKYELCGLEEPEEITKASENLRRSNDPVKQFVDERVIRDVGGEAAISVRNLYENFKEWYQETFPSGRVINFERFKQDIVKYDLEINSVNLIIGIDLGY